MKSIAEHWQEAANLMAIGKSPPDFKIGKSKNWYELVPLLKSRAEILIDWVNDERIWKDF